MISKNNRCKNCNFHTLLKGGFVISILKNKCFTKCGENIFQLVFFDLFSHISKCLYCLFKFARHWTILAIFVLFSGFQNSNCFNDITKDQWPFQWTINSSVLPLLPRRHVGIYFKDFKFQTNFLDSHFADKTDICRQIFWNIDLLLKLAIGDILCSSSSTNLQIFVQKLIIYIEQQRPITNYQNMTIAMHIKERHLSLLYCKNKPYIFCKDMIPATSSYPHDHHIVIWWSP